jgi:L-amino acid N-acyltransferase YncA
MTTEQTHLPDLHSTPAVAPRNVCLRNGVSVQVRSVHVDDRAAVLAFLTELSAPAQKMRFFTGGADLTTAASWAAGADGRNHLGLLALDDAGEIVGHAACCRVYGHRAEVAVEISDRARHQGLATLLIAELARRAEALGIRAFVAEVLPENHEMLSVFHDGFDATQSLRGGEVDIEFPTSAWRRAEPDARESATSPRPHPES